MSDDKYRAELNFGEGKEPPSADSCEAEGLQGPADTPQKGGQADEREEFSSTLEESTQNADRAGRAAAKRFMEGLLVGTGKKVAETVWVKVKELIGQGDS